MENYELNNIIKKSKVKKKKQQQKKTIIKFDDIEIEKQKFHQHKKPILIKNVGIKKIVVSNKVSFGKKSFKNFIGSKNA